MILCSIFLVRLGLTSYYDYRISSIQGHLDELKKQRDTTIKKLKAATKYDSTLELIKRYSGSPIPKTKPGASERRTTSKQGDTGATKGGRTMFVPPATANIPGRTGPPIDANSPQEPPKPQNRSSRIQSSAAIAASSVQMPLSPLDLSADFAPNAFLAPSQYAQADDGPRWYDRIMDVLLGEDETSPRNRLALICSNCRLVNGQAPPGVKRLEDLGKWRCGGCGIMNGEESEAKRIVASLKERTTSEKEQSSIEEDDDHNSGVGNTKQTKAPAFDGDESDGVRYSSGSSAESAAESEATDDLKQRVAEPETPRRRSTRQKASGKQIT